MMKIRLADYDDVNAIMKMQKDLFFRWHGMDEADRIKEGYLGSEEHRKDIKTDIGQYIIAVDNDKRVLGYLRMRIEAREKFLEKAGSIDEMYVVPEKRGSGAGKMLSEHAADAFRKMGLKWSMASTHTDDAEANRFWKKQGFRQFNLMYAKRI